MRRKLFRVLAALFTSLFFAVVSYCFITLSSAASRNSQVELPVQAGMDTPAELEEPKKMSAAGAVGLKIYKLNPSGKPASKTMFRKQEKHFEAGILKKKFSVKNHLVQPRCSNRLCTQNLSPEDESRFIACQRVARIHPDSDRHARCHFIDGRRRDPVALVSVPGAGNTWVRSLLEQATGICTGAIYCDLPLRKEGFVGEYIHSGSVSVVKTHTSDYQWKGEVFEQRNHEDALYGSAILLIRNPFDNFVSERNRVATLKQLGAKAEHGEYVPVLSGRVDSSHVHSLNASYFGNCSEWKDFLYGIGPRWKKTIDKWFLHSLGHPIMVVRYEDLKRDTLTEVKRMLRFLKFSYDEQSLLERLAKKDSRSFHRSPADSNFEHYTSEQKTYINSLLQDTIQLLKRNNASVDLFNLHEYLVKI